MLIQRFIEKGCKKKALLKIREHVDKMRREELLQQKPKNIKNRDLTFVTGYNLQYRNVEKV